MGKEKEIWGKLSDHQGQQEKTQIKVENERIKTVKTGKWDARQSMSDNAHCCPKASERPVEPGQRCPARSDGTHFRASSSLILLELQKGLESKLGARCLSWAGSSIGWRSSTEQSSTLVLVGATGLLSIFQKEADCFATRLQIWELPSR